MSYLSAEIRALADHYGVDSVLRAAASILTGEAPPKAWAKKAAQQSPDKYRNECCPRCGTSVFDRATVIKAVQVDGLCEGDPVQVLKVEIEALVCRQCGHLLDERMVAAF